VQPAAAMQPPLAHLPKGAPLPTPEDPTAGGNLCGARRKPGQVEQDRARGVAEPWPWCAARAGHGTDHPGVAQCKAHGGSTPSGRKSARLRYAGLQDAVVETFARIMVDPSAPYQARLRAAENLADRGGSPRRHEVDVDAGRDTLVERLMELQAGDEASS
jgi:hypothetical protein